MTTFVAKQYAPGHVPSLMDAYLVEYPTSHLSFEVMGTAREAVQLTCGCDPDYYLVGIPTYWELVVQLGEERMAEMGEFRAIPFEVHYFAAMPPVEWLVGRRMPLGSQWVWVNGEWSTHP